MDSRQAIFEQDVSNLTCEIAFELLSSDFYVHITTFYAAGTLKASCGKMPYNNSDSFRDFQIYGVGALNFDRFLSPLAASPNTFIFTLESLQTRRSKFSEVSKGFKTRWEARNLS